MNVIWFFLLGAAFVAAAFNDSMAAVGEAIFESAKGAVSLAIGLIGTMAFWIGLMQVLRDGGLTRQIARALKPLMVRLFPEVPAEHPAMSAMIMNFAANMLGLGNAATPFGIKAMMELDRLNPHKGTATNAMALFLAINTSALSLLPTGVMAMRASLGSAAPGAIVLPSLLATICSTLVAVVAAKLLSRAPWYAVSPATEGANAVAASAREPSPAAAPAAEVEELEQAPELPPSTPALWGLTTRRRAAVLLLGTGFSGCALYWYGAATWRSAGQCKGQAGCLATDAIQHLSTLILPGLIVLILLYGVGRGVRIYQSFVEGAKEGLQVAVRIIPYLVAILVAVGMLKASGGLDAFTALIAPLVEPLGMPAEVLPMALIRPLSGSGAFGVMTATMQEHGPDSMIGYMVSVLNGSMETTFYVIAVYFGAVRISRVRHALPAGLLADLAGLIATVAVCRAFF